MLTLKVSLTPRPPDSRRIVHAIHAMLAGLGVRAWFDYVRSKANVSDEPSRDADLADSVMRLASRGRRVMLASHPIDLLLPESEAWACEAAAWHSAVAGLD